MDCAIRRLPPQELDAALSLAWETFLTFEAPDYGSEGVDAFRRDIIENAAFHAACRSGENRIWGAFDVERLIGIFAMRGPSHICLVFTHRDYHRKGVASAIFRQLVQDVRAENPEVRLLTLNSSPYGKPFYRRVGFVPTDRERQKHGIRYTPMAYPMASDTDYEALKAWLEETRNEPLEAMDAFFDRRIGGYEDHMSPWQRHYAWMAELLPDGIASLLDIGCGSGLELDGIFRRFPDLAVTGIDLSREMLAKLSGKHAGRQLTILQGDYFHQELGENRFDAAVAFETLHHFPAGKKQELFAKIRRSLKPGGIYLECDYIAASQEIEDLLFDAYHRRRQRDRIPPEVYVHFDTPLTLVHEVEAMETAGFSEVRLAGYLPGDNNTAMILAVK